MPAEVGVEEVGRLVPEENAQLVEVLPEREYEGRALARCNQPPPSRSSPRQAPHISIRAARHRLLLGRCLRHESAGCHAARSTGFFARLRLRWGKVAWSAAGLPLEGRGLHYPLVGKSCGSISPPAGWAREPLMFSRLKAGAHNFCVCAKRARDSPWKAAL